ncbi:non-homologous end-joining DNA ligase [Candidatus Dependentiae bacterium]|nr:non-homologous end-joining DNA ligase [Candidatus Dependentiae bacterium]
MAKIKIGSIEIQTSNEKKILFPKSKITKGDLIDYYAKISDIMIPYIANRPVTMHRFPNSIHEGFFYKDAASYFPKWMKRFKVAKKEGGHTNYIVCNNKASLVYLANQAVITPHIWLSQIDKIKFPDRMIFDFDPEKQTFKTICKFVLKFKKLLDSFDITSFVMTTGSRGLHVVIPLDKSATFKESKKCAKLIAQEFIKMYPDDFTMEVRKNKRQGKIFLDTLRNEFAQTGVAPYAVRAIEKAPVATPLEWREVSKTSSAQKFNINNIFKRLSRKKDPWHSIQDHKTSIKKIMTHLR